MFSAQGHFQARPLGPHEPRVQCWSTETARHAALQIPLLPSANKAGSSQHFLSLRGFPPQGWGQESLSLLSAVTLVSHQAGLPSYLFSASTIMGLPTWF